VYPVLVGATAGKARAAGIIAGRSLSMAALRWHHGLAVAARVAVFSARAPSRPSGRLSQARGTSRPGSRARAAGHGVRLTQRRSAVRKATPDRAGGFFGGTVTDGRALGVGVGQAQLGYRAPCHGASCDSCSSLPRLSRQ
jgi:hypothetical protein